MQNWFGDLRRGFTRFSINKNKMTKNRVKIKMRQFNSTFLKLKPVVGTLTTVRFFYV